MELSYCINLTFVHLAYVSYQALDQDYVLTQEAEGSLGWDARNLAL